MELGIKGYEDYSVTTDGEIYSTKYKQKRMLKPRVNKRGYMYVNLSKDGKYKSVKVHIIVAKTFLENPNNLPEVNHIDGNKTNNKKENLEWCTKHENMKHAFRIGLIKSLKFGEESFNAKLTEKDVKEIRQKYIPRVYTMKMLSKEYGVTVENIKLIVTRKIWKDVN